MFGRLLALLVTACVSATHAASLQWEWLTPVPHRQSWRSLAAGNGQVVGLTDGLGGRSIYTWVNYSNWVAVTSPTNFRPTKVIFAEGQFFAVGNNSTVITSKDGIDWKVRHTDTGGASFYQIAVGSGVYVTLAGGPYLAYSKDLATWKTVMPESGFSFTALAFGNGKFVAVGQSRKLFTSTDGATWTNIPWPDSAPAADWSTQETGLVFRNGLFLMANHSGAATSVDGEHWSAASTDWFNGIAATADGYLAFNYGSVSVSATGTTWSRVMDVELPTGTYLNCAVSADGRTVVAGDHGALFTTTDLVNWRRWVKPVDYTDSQIAFGNDVYLRYGGTNGICISSNGSDWQRIETAPGLKAAVFANGVWVAFDQAGNGAVSVNGKSWETFPLPAVAKSRLLFADGRFVAEAEGGFLTSVDGRNWQFVAVAGAQSVTLIGRANGIWSANVDGRSATSGDGVVWTLTAEQVPGQVFAAGNGRFVAISGGDMGMGSVWTSSDGVHWAANGASPSTHQTQSLTFLGGLFIFTDRAGGVYHSADGVNWGGGGQASQTFTSAAYGNGEFLVCGGDAILRSTTRVQSNSTFRLQLIQSSFGNWTLSVAGNAGQLLQIESTSDLNGTWSEDQLITVPQSGVAELPVGNAPSRFYRARAVTQ